MNQIWQEYKKTGEQPVIGQNIGRPVKPLTEVEATVIKQAYEQYRFGARMLEPIIRKK